jgi:hypothetical protein
VKDKSEEPGMRCKPIVPTLRRLRQEDLEFEARKGYTARPFLKKTKKSIIGLKKFILKF